MADAWKDDLLQIDNMLWYAWQCVCTLMEGFPDPIHLDIPPKGLEEAPGDADMDISGGSIVWTEGADMDISGGPMVWISFRCMFSQALRPQQQIDASATASQVPPPNISLRNYYCPCGKLGGAYCSGLMNHLYVLSLVSTAVTHNFMCYSSKNMHCINIKKGKARNMFLKNGSPDDLAGIISNWLKFGYTP
jgi:hypothetical protein